MNSKISLIDATAFNISEIENALKQKQTEIRLFGKPSTRKYHRMGVALARGKTTDFALK